MIGNTATAIGGGIASISTDTPITEALVTNSIVWGNSAPLGPQLAALGQTQCCGNFQSELSVSFTDAEGGAAAVYVDSNSTFNWLAGNIDLDPLFVDPGNGDYHVQSGSPVIDAGDNTAVPAGVTTDLDGNPRFMDDPLSPNTGVPGNGHAEIVDMGAYEFPGEFCYADCDGSGTLDLFDFLCFQNSFVNSEPYACDCDITTGTNPPVCDIFDFLCFQNAFVAGCP